MRKSKRRSSGYFGFPKEVLKSPAYIALGYPAKALLVDLRTQFNGFNNGDLHAAWSILSRERGWNSRDTLHHALQELIYCGFVKCVRKGGSPRLGGRPSPSLFALTWEPVDRNGSSLPTTSPTHDYRNAREPWRRKPRNRNRSRVNSSNVNTIAVAVRHGNRSGSDTEDGHFGKTTQQNYAGSSDTVNISPTRKPGTLIGYQSIAATSDTESSVPRSVSINTQLHDPKHSSDSLCVLLSWRLVSGKRGLYAVPKAIDSQRSTASWRRLAQASLASSERIAA